MKKFDFIINPHSGSGRGKKDIPELIHELSIKYGIICQFHFTEYAGHAEIIAKNLVLNSTENIVAVGGDGTVNEIANAMIDSNSILGILPIGSGNGLARHLGIPMTITKAFEVLVHHEYLPIDAIGIGYRFSVNVSGLGFDSFVAEKFKHSKHRGLEVYTAIAMKEFIHYQNGNFNIELDDQTIDTSAFLVSIANSCQFGNNVKISPDASVQDGLIDVVIIKPFPFAMSVSFLPFIVAGVLNKSPYVEVYKTKKVTIIHDQKNCHIDGESVECGNTLSAEIKTKCLNVIYNKQYFNRL